MRLQALIFTGLVVFLFYVQSVYSTNTTATISISLNVTSVCSVSSSDLVFPSMQTGTTIVGNTTSTIIVNCSNGSSYSVALDSGQNLLSTQRRMRRGSTSDYINYNIYSDSGFSVPWTTISGLSGTGVNQTITTYGAVPSAQSILDSGNYTDQVTATITY